MVSLTSKKYQPSLLLNIRFCKLSLICTLCLYMFIHCDFADCVSSMISGTAIREYWLYHFSPAFLLVLTSWCVTIDLRTPSSICNDSATLFKPKRITQLVLHNIALYRKYYSAEETLEFLTPNMLQLVFPFLVAIQQRVIV